MAGQKINDHSNFTGRAPKGQVFAEGNKVKSYSSAEGSGEVGKYEDTSEAIHSAQVKGVSQAKSHPLKSGYRY
jgi:hypothetical protein